MKKLSSLLAFSFLALTFFFITACCSKKKVTTADSKTETPAAQPAIDFEKNGYVKAIVINYEVDGCGYLLQLEDGKKLQAGNLSFDYKKDKLAVWIKYFPRKGGGISVCMAGQMVELSDIQLRK